MSTASASSARPKASTPAWCSTRSTTSTASSTRCASATSRASASTKRCFQGKSCRRKTKVVFTERGAKVRLDRIPVEPPKSLSKEAARGRFAKLGEELFDLQDQMWGAKVNSALIVLQGRDSAGKDGAIKHVAEIGRA